MHYKITAMTLDYCIKKHFYDIGLFHYKNTAMKLDYSITKTLL